METPGRRASLGWKLPADQFGRRTRRPYAFSVAVDRPRLSLSLILANLSKLVTRGKNSAMNPGRQGRIDLRRVTADDWRLWRGLRLAALQEAPYAFGSRLSDWTGVGDTEVRWRSRLASVPFNLVAYLDGLRAGIVSGAKPEGRTAQLLSMWVAPSARGQGVGDSLIEAVVEWSRGVGAEVTHLDVFEDNERAIRLYRRHGFVDRGRKPSEPDDDPVRVERRMVLLLTSPH